MSVLTLVRQRTQTTPELEIGSPRPVVGPVTVTLLGRRDTVYIFHALICIFVSVT